ncbi:MAG: hypothetical protein A2Y02_03225 [Omnitrophica bacterium GWA2_52_12]|nr:MAG: hypothetical protein A2Y02_03225 [Omnitrophica bacterium GWA2_52_12]
MLQNLDHAYDEYLKAREAQVVKAIPAFLERLEKSNFRYGRFLIPTFYKPHFMSAKQEHLVKRAARSLSQALNMAAHLYFEEGHLTQMFRMHPEAARLIKINPGYSESVIFSRFNSILEGESLKVLEFNCDSPVGAAYTDEIENLLLAEEPLTAFFEEYHIQRRSRSQAVLDALLAAYEQFGGYETPNIAIVDWHNVRTVPEFESLKRYFESKGYKTFIADPRELKFRGGKLYFKSTHIRLMLRRVFFDELLERIDEVEDLIKAYESQAVCMVNSLRARLAGSKAIHAILTNPAYEHFFTEIENQAKREYIPWTRRISDAEDFYGRSKTYLIDFLKDEKDSLVLKPSMGHGGRDVSLGCETRDDDWNVAIARALKEDWVVQEYVHVPILTVPALINNKLDFAYKKYNFNMLVFGGKYAGAFTRLSDESVINVARQGGLIPSLAPEQAPERIQLS